MIPEDTISFENGVFYIDQSGTEEELKVHEGDRFRFKYQGEQYVAKVLHLNHNNPHLVPITEFRKI